MAEGISGEGEDAELSGEPCADRQIQTIGQAMAEVMVAEATDHRGIVRAVFWGSQQQLSSRPLAGIVKTLPQIAVACHAST